MNGSQHRPSLGLADSSSSNAQSQSQSHSHSFQQHDASPSPSSSALAPNTSNHAPSHAPTDPHPSPLTKYSDLPSMSTGTGMGINGGGGGGGMNMSTDYADGLSTTRTISVSTPHTNTMTFSSGRTMSLFHPHGTSISASPTLASQTRSHSHDHSLPPPSLQDREAGAGGGGGKQAHMGGAKGALGTKSFLDGRDEAVRRARKVYMKIYATGLCAVVVTIFIVFPLYWGSLWQIPAHAMRGWIVNFDGGTIGQRVLSDLSAASGRSIHWQEVPSTQFPNGPNDLINAIKDNQAWVAVSINPGSTARYLNSLQNPDPAYNGSAVVTAYGVEGRNENAFRVLIRPYIYTTLAPLLDTYSAFLATQLVSSNSSRGAADLVSLMSVSPQTVTQPVGYTLVNLIPFAQPVASAVVFVGLIYLLILSFFIVAIAYNARQVSGINTILSFRSLVLVRLSSSAIGYFCLSFFYSLLNVAFKLNLSRKYGAAGFVIFWMLNWLGMLSVGLALESLITLLTPKWVPFFMIAWIIVNVSVCVFPIDVLPRFYRYGYAMPFYNISSSVRSITFGTRNTLGQNFGVLFAWVLISCITLPSIQWYVRRQETRAKAAPGPGNGAGPGERRSSGGGGKEAGSAASTPELKSQSRVPSGDQEKQAGR